MFSTFVLLLLLLLLLFFQIDSFSYICLDLWPSTFNLDSNILQEIFLMETLRQSHFSMDTLRQTHFSTETLRHPHFSIKIFSNLTPVWKHLTTSLQYGSVEQLYFSMETMPKDCFWNSHNNFEAWQYGISTLEI